jgi:hypothetical protein
MIPTRAALAIPAAVLVISGCGAAAPHAPHTTTVAMHLPATAPAIPATALLRPLPVMPVAPTYLVATVATGSSSEWIEILTPSGTVVARKVINPTQVWMVASGAGGAYWSEDGAEYEMTPAGAIHKLGPLASDASGVVIAPDGVSYAYATSETLSNGNLVNHIDVVHPGEAPQVITDKGAPTQAEVNADGYNWDYYLVSWTASGIAFARVPQGGCGCGAFDMQMQSAYSAIVDPVSDGETTVTSTSSCPLSDLGPALESVCFAGANATDAIQIASAGIVTHTYTLSGKNFAGDALFSADGSQLAYITLPVADMQECGQAMTSTLRVMNLATGTTVDRYLGDFVPSTWAGGLIYGTVTNADSTASWLVGVNPTTLAVTRLTPNGDWAGIIGVI